MGLYWASNTTRRERPVMLTADIEGNRFAYDPATLDNAQPYKYMAFKSTVNEIVPAGTGSFQLKKAALKTKMFRGYASHEVFPIAFTAATMDIIASGDAARGEQLAKKLAELF